MTSFASRAVSAAACALGLHHAARWLHRRQLLVLCYHGVTDRTSARDQPTWHHLPVSEFVQHMNYLRAHYRVLPIDEAVAQLRRGAIDQPTASITFDDGYRNNVSVALPVLQRMKLPATVYLATDFIGTDRQLWTVQLDSAFHRSNRATVDLSGLGMSGATVITAAGRTALARRVIEHLKQLEPVRRDQILTKLLHDLGPDNAGGDDRFTFLDWSDVARMEATGLISFGAHTARHEIVSRLPADRLQTEIGGSVAVTRAHVDKPSVTFAYPNGRAVDFDERAKRTLQEHGVTAAVTTISGLNRPETDPFELRRVTIGADMSFAQFCALSSGLVLSYKRLLRSQA